MLQDRHQRASYRCEIRIATSSSPAVWPPAIAANTATKRAEKPRSGPARGMIETSLRRVNHFNRCSVRLLLSLLAAPLVGGMLDAAHGSPEPGVLGPAELEKPARVSTTESTHQSPAPPEAWAGKLYAQAKDSIVMVSAGASEGTGFAFISANLIATAFHVIEGEVAPTVTLSNGTQLPARVVAWDERWDLALLELPRPIDGPPLQVIGEGQTRVGDPVATIGNPWGAEQRKLPDSSAPVWALSHGIVSAPPGDLVQTDAPVNPGNSGGPLLTSHGRVVGVLVVRVEGSDGISFAVGAKHLIALATRIGQQDTYSIAQLRMDHEVFWLPIGEYSLNGLAIGLRFAHRSRFGLALRAGRLWGSRVVHSVLEHRSRNRWLIESELLYYLVDGPGLSIPVGAGIALAWDSVQTHTIRVDSNGVSEDSITSSESSLRALFGLAIDTPLLSLHTGVYALGGETGARLALGLVF